MNKDIRIAVTFLDHPKTIKLQRRLGDGAVLCLLRLWFHAAQHKPDGVLSGMSEEDVEIAARWLGDNGTFAKALLDVGFLEHQQDQFVLHDWPEHNPYAAHAPARQERARKAAAVRHAKADVEQCSTHNLAMLRAGVSIAPSPAPSPSPDPKKINGGSTPPARRVDYTPEFEIAWSSFPQRYGDNPKKQAFHAWNARLREGHNTDEMLSGTRRYRAYCDSDGKTGTEFVMQAKRFFGPDKPFLLPWKAERKSIFAGAK